MCVCSNGLYHGGSTGRVAGKPSHVSCSSGTCSLLHNLSKELEVTIRELMGAVKRDGLARKLSSGAVYGQVHNEIFSHGQGWKVLKPLQPRSPPFHPELTSPQPRELLVLLDSTWARQSCNFHQEGGRFPNLSSSVATPFFRPAFSAHVSQGIPSALLFNFEMRSLLVVHVTV